MALVTIAEADTFLSSSTVWDGLADAAKTTHIASATTFLNNLKWKGVIADYEQADSWPRTSVYDSERRYVDSDTIPELIKNACAQLALKAAEGESLYPDYASQKVKSKSVKGGSASVQTVWESGSSEPQHKWPEIFALFTQFLMPQNGIMRA